MKNIILFFAFLMLGIIVHAQNGLYLKLQYWGSNLDIEWLYFQDSVLVKNPKYGITPLQVEQERLIKSEDVANILQVSNNKMSIQWGNGINEAILVEFQDKDLVKFKGIDCKKAIPVNKNQFDNKSYSGLVNFKNLSKDIRLVFSNDGKFTSITKTPEGTSLTEEGRFYISENTISFKYNNGKQGQAFIHTFDSGQDDLIINHQLFKLIH